MSLFGDVLRRLRALLPGVEPAESEAEDEDATAADRAYQCTICGTPVEDPDGECPLCGSTDLVAVGEADDRDGGPSGDATPRESIGGTTPTVGEALADRDPLEAYADRWEEGGDGTAPYRVRLPDGEVAHAGTREEVRSLLFEHYGPPEG